ncbi:hypothetical protein HIM_02399 [Hirsutella minnesotensis 3608]|nr:hypothetical protein HIM_02399 [Hirsutella minnesotensis 3608]
MASTCAAAPPFHNDCEREPRHLTPPQAAFASQSLSPPVAHDTHGLYTQSASPPDAQFDAQSAAPSNLSSYQPSVYSEDPFFGADFNIDNGTPSFLDQSAGLHQEASTANDSSASLPLKRHEAAAIASSYPLTPAQTASVYATTPRSEHRGLPSRVSADQSSLSISPEQLQKPFRPPAAAAPSAEATSTRSSSNRTSEDSLVPDITAMATQSPRVTVSVWDKDGASRAPVVERSFDNGMGEVRGSIPSAGDLISSAHNSDYEPNPRYPWPQWRDHDDSQRRGLGPEHRQPGETMSINQAAAQRSIQQRNNEVGRWLSERLDGSSIPQELSAQHILAIEEMSSHHNDGIPLGDQTENKYLDGQTYYNESGSGLMSQTDRDIIAADSKWADAPMLHHITRAAPGQCQPQSSQAAIERFEMMCRDNDSILSRSATWGTRRRSHPSVLDLEVDGITSGSFFKKLSLGRSNGEKSSKAGSLLREIRGFVRRPSVSSLRKRSRSRSRGPNDEGSPPRMPSEQPVKRASTPRLTSMSRSTSCDKKSTPSLNTTLVSMAQNFVSAHTRRGSVGGTNTGTSPKTGLASSLSVRSSLGRPRSKSEIPKAPVMNNGASDSPQNLTGMWKRSGGPPVATLAKTNSINVDDDDDDDDDELYEDGDVRANPNLIDDVTPNYSGFQQYLVALNPGLDETHGYLVDRIAHQQVVRYKHLLNAKVKHLGMGANCPCGPLCLALGGSANVLDQRADVDPLAAQLNSGDDDCLLGEGVINHGSFPQDIPMPPTQRLPAEFECQLCYQRKRFQKPSDWTKHVHEDVQPFTCTWDKCRDPKIFKRKADWVRHENEGHRHLEWWTCDVDDCRHTCYRRDNFLQHLVREHKFREPKVKTKAAMKRAGGMDPTWQKVEQCHVETSARPQEEPCRFCGKVLPTWKKLTVHLAKHMEQIALPVLRLVAAKAKELDADTIISPVQDPPPRPMASFSSQTTLNIDYPSFPIHSAQRQPQQVNHHQQQMGYVGSGSFGFPVVQSSQHQSSYYAPALATNGQVMQQPAMGVGQLHQGNLEHNGLQGVQGPSAGFSSAPSMYAGNEMEPFPQFDALGLANVGDMSMSGHLGYETMSNRQSINGSPYSGHENIPTYSHSPHRNEGIDGGQEPPWDGARMNGFL